MNHDHLSPGPIRVLITDDSAFMRTALTRMIQSDPALLVVGTAQNGKEALEQITRLDPDVITLDIEMPLLNGLGVLRRLQQENPKPVIMVSSLTQEGAEATLEAFELGAFDCIAKTRSFATLDILNIREELTSKIKAAAHSGRSRPQPVRSPAPPAAAPRRIKFSNRVSRREGFAPSIVAIGTSTGGPKALQEVLPLLPPDLPAGIVIVQHMPEGFTGPFAQRLNSRSQIQVREAVDGEPVAPGIALIAPATWHLTFVRASPSQFNIRLSKEPANTLHRPSVDVTLLSAAEVCGPQAMGVIMTGMGADGALGMKALHDRGGFTLGQDESTCAVYGMPRSCAEMGSLDRVVPLLQIPEEIVHATSGSQLESRVG